MEHPFWFASLLNHLLGGTVTPLLLKLGITPADPGQPIPGYLAAEIMAMLIIVAGALILRRQLSVENPGRFQQAMELVLEFTQTTAQEIIGHEGQRYVPLLGTLFIYVLLCNVLGLVPTLQTPTAHIEVTLGLAALAFLYYNYHGIRHHGIVGYLKHLCGPMLAIAIVMFPIELISNFGRLLSLSVRLYANMLVGDVLEQVFGSMVHIAVPVIFMALHIFVSLLQAYIFMLLPAIYISMATAEEH